MTGLIIFLIIIAVIFLLLIIPVNLYVEYDGENTSLKVRYAFIKIKILPQSEKKKKSPKKSSDKKKKSKPDGKQTDKKKEEKKDESRFSAVFKAKGIVGIAEIIGEIILLAKGFLRDTLSHVIVHKLIVRVNVSTDDAYDTAMRFGYACDAVYPAIGAASAFFTFRRIPEIEINADFDSGKTKIYLFLRLYVRPLFLLSSLIVYGIKSIALYLKIIKA